MKKITHYLSLVMLVCVTLFSAGCASNTQLDPSGVYQSDQILFTADKAITGSYSAFDSFVKWEYENRQALSRWPEIKAAADNIRTNAKSWIGSATVLREAYRSSPTPENRKSLESSVAILRAALNQVASYYTSHPKPSK
jgi:alpha-galactosidase